MVFTKASAPRPFLRRAVAAAPLPWLLTVGPCCSHYSLFSAAVSDQAIGPSSPGLCLLMFETSHIPTPTPALSYVTPNTRKEDELVLSFPSYLLASACASKHLPFSRSWTWGAVLQQCFCWQRVLRDSSVVLSSPSVNSWYGLCALAS